MEELAIFGGTPVRETKLYYGKQWISEEDITAVAETLRSPLITQGPNVNRLEETLCELTGAQYAACCSNGTAALHLACLAAGVQAGDEVITTPMTFAASANCAFYCGATPVFADIDPATYNIDPDSIRRCITPRTKAVVAVDFTGQIVQADEIRAICDEYHLVFIEDASHSIGGMYKGRPVGSFADMTTMSFHPVKTVTGGEGGAVLTNHKAYYDKVMLYRTHGITHTDSEMVHKPDGPWYYEQIALGYNYRLTDFQAALLVSQLSRIGAFAARRKEIVRAYNAAFSELPEIIVQKEIPESGSCRHLYIIQLDLAKLNCTRLEFFNAMAAENVQPQVHYVPVYFFPYYEAHGYRRGLCPNAERLYEGIMSIPLYPALTDKDVQDVIHAVEKICRYYRKA